MVTLAEPRIRILSRTFRLAGARGVVGIVTKKLGAMWRCGEIWQLGRFVGMPTDIVRLDGCKFTIDKRYVPTNVVDLLISNRYEGPERRTLKDFLDPAVPVVELGGCIGVVACLTNRLLQRPDKHVVVEANPRLLPILRRNRDRNGCRFSIDHAALSYDAATIPFRVNDNVLASSLHGDDEPAEVVSTVTLRQLLNDHGFERATLICDIEGAERQLVEREIDTLAERVAMIMMELHGPAREQPASGLLASLERAGFALLGRDHDVVVLRNERIARHHA